MSSRIVYDDDALEEYFRNVMESDEPLKLFNTRIFLKALMVMVQIEVLAFFSCSSLMNGVFLFNWDMFWMVQTVQVLPVLKAAWNATMNFKMREFKKNIVKSNAGFIKAKTAQIQVQEESISVLKVQVEEQRKLLNTQASLHLALLEANTIAEYELVKKLILKEQELVREQQRQQCTTIPRQPDVTPTITENDAIVPIKDEPLPGLQPDN